MPQVFKRWNPGQLELDFVSIESLVDRGDEFQVCLREHATSKLLCLRFADRLAYQCRDESDLEGEAARSEGLGKGCFYTVEESELLARFRADSVRSYDGITHFAIVTDADCIDVLSIEQPAVEYL